MLYKGFCRLPAVKILVSSCYSSGHISLDGRGKCTGDFWSNPLVHSLFFAHFSRCLGDIFTSPEAVKSAGMKGCTGRWLVVEALSKGGVWYVLVVCPFLVKGQQ